MATTLDTAIVSALEALQGFSIQENFWDLFETAFGQNYDRSRVEELRSQWQAGDSGIFPIVEVVSQETLGIALGAYGLSTGVIYLSEDLVGRDTGSVLLGVLLEEYGHFVDAQVNTIDSPGDEGAIFAELVQGNSLDVATLETLRGENEQTTITVNGEIIQVEQADLIGTDGNDNITGTSEDDNINGLDGNDILNGEAGNDKLYSDNGSDTINGGTDFDYYVADYSDRTTGLTMTYDPTTGNGTITVGTEVDTLISIESFNEGFGLNGGFRGTNFNDVIVGSSDNENYYWYGIFGLDGNDTVSGGEGDDKVFGGDGNDIVNGDTGNDELYGGNGNDILQGTNGDTGEQDYLEGGLGSDRFVLGDFTWIGYDDNGDNDYANIVDFNSSQGDVIQLKGSSTDYLLEVSGADTRILIDRSGTDELIAIITNQSNLSLTDAYFTYNSSITLPSITLAVAPVSIAEDNIGNLIYTFTRTGETTSTLTVNYSIAGTADSADYTGATPGIGQTITFEAGSSTATLTIDPTLDTEVESDETVELTLAGGTGYTIATTDTVVGTIANDDTNPQPNVGVLRGTSQNDTLDATPGQYTVIPFTGDDTILVNTASDVIIELPNEGTDTIVSSVNYNLAAQTHIENLTLTGTDDITGIGNRRDNIITANSGQNVLVGLQGDDTFVFNFGDSSVTKPDRIRDFGVGQDRIQIGDRLLAPNELPNATNNTATDLTDLVNSVFADANGVLSGNQPLEINSAALVTSTVLGIAATYLVVNDETVGFNAETDLIINIGSSPVISFNII